MFKKEDLIALAKYLSIVSHTKGRIRLRVSPSIIKEADNFDKSILDTLPQKIEGIKDLKVNMLIGSVTISYDAEVFNPQIWDEMIKGELSDELLERLQDLIKEA